MLAGRLALEPIDLDTEVAGDLTGTFVEHMLCHGPGNDLDAAQVVRITGLAVLGRFDDLAGTGHDGLLEISGIHAALDFPVQFAVIDHVVHVLPPEKSV